jgi:hypothetical protein
VTHSVIVPILHLSTLTICGMRDEPRALIIGTDKMRPSLNVESTRLTIREAGAIKNQWFSMSPSVTAPRSHIYEWYFGRCPCPKCGESLAAAEYSEFLKHNHVRHTWRCDKCDYVFETLFWLNIPAARPDSAMR